MKLKKLIQEVLTPQEQGLLQGYSQEFQKSVSNIAKSLRKGGKNVPLPSIVQQMGQFQPGPEIDKFLQTSGLLAPMANRLSAPAVQNPFQRTDALPFLKNVKPQSAPRTTMTPQQAAQAPAPTPAVSPRLAALRKTPVPQAARQTLPPVQAPDQDLELFQQRIAGQAPSIDDQYGTPQQQLLSPQEKRRRMQLSQQIGNKNTMRKESKNLQEFNMSMIGGGIKNVISLISKMKPEELIAIAGFINSLMQKSGGSSSYSRASSTSIGEAKMRQLREAVSNKVYQFSPDEIAQLRRMLPQQSGKPVNQQTQAGNPMANQMPPTGNPSPMDMFNQAQRQVSPPSTSQASGKTPYPAKKGNNVYNFSEKEIEQMRQMIQKQGGVRENMNNKYKEVLKENIAEQIKLRNLTEHYLNEGPLSSVWQGIKQAGSTAANALMGKSAAKGAQNVGVGENTKKLGQELTKSIGKVNQMRHKFNSSILKNSEAVSQYHDLVQNLWQMYNQNLHVLGPFAKQLQRQVQDAVGNFHYDLTSEKEQIDSFLNSLKGVKAGGPGMGASFNKSSEELGQGAHASAQEKRQAEADAMQRMTSSSTKAVSGGKHKALDALRHNTNAEKEQIKKRISTAGSAAEKQAAIRDLEKLFTKTSKRNTKDKDD